MITVNNLQFRYPGANTDTLNGLSFSFREGEIFGFLGPSGSGKSTTQKILYKLLAGYRGEVDVGGEELSSLGQGFFHRIGVGFELPNHYLKLSGRENLQLFGQFYKKSRLRSADDLMEQVGLLEDADKKVEGYSKGMKMRLNFIRALLHDPEILFFDEPTSGMDPANAQVIKDMIRAERARGKAVFITTHNMFTADQLCDQVAFIHRGELVARDSPANFKHQHGQDRVRVSYSPTLQLADAEFPLEDIGGNKAFREALQAAEVRSIHTLEASLEEVFLQLTGNTLQS